MTAERTTLALCICDRAVVPANLPAPLRKHPVEITTRGKDAEINFVVEHLIEKLGGHIEPRVLDLLSLAAYCFAADRMVRRGGAVDVHREGWRRELTLCLPVSDPTFWSRPNLLRLLTETLDFGTDDRWSFHFSAVDRTTPQLAITWDDRELLSQPDTVVLFSGGTDSLCGLVEGVTQQGARPVLVSHWAADHVKARQQRLRAAVRRTFEDWEFPHVQVELHRHDKRDGESSQRTRGFLFACLGAAIAAHLGVKTVLLPENGYVSINPQINDQLRGALASRGTHPKFLFLFNRLIDLVFDGRVEVVNPLWNKTRAEALTTLKDAGCQQLLRQTYSCGKLQGRSAGKSHCGGCSQCVDRRFAMLKAELEEHDPLEQYEFDMFTQFVPEGEARTVTVSYVRCAGEMSPLDPEVILDQRRELDLCVDPDDPDADQQCLELAALLRRHSEEAIAVMEQMYRRWSRELAQRLVDPHSLLVLWPRQVGTMVNAVDRAHESRSVVTNAVSSFGVTSTTSQSSFQRTGRVWFITFRDEKGGLPNRIGVQRLARILKANGQELEAFTLAHDTTAQDTTEETQIPQADASLDRRASHQADVGDVLDSDAIDAYRDRLDELDRQIKVARAADDARKATDGEREKAWLERELRMWVGMHDKPRHFPEAHERARQTVSKTVWREVRALDESMPLLRAHFETFVHLGFICWYEPDPPEWWDVSL